MITTTEYFTNAGRDLTAAGLVPPQHLINARVFLNKLNPLLAAFDAQRGSYFIAIVNSGYRTQAINNAIPDAAIKSKHMTGNAIDIRDVTGELKNWLITAKGKETMKACGLCMEHPSATPRWCHLQDVPVKSGNLIFYP